MVKRLKTSRYRGLGLVEAAIVLPIVILIIFGLMEYGWMFLKMHQISNAARHGARIAVLSNATTLDVETAIDNLMIQANINPLPEPVITGMFDDVGQPVTVTITVPKTDVSLFNVPLLPLHSGDIVSSVTMSKEGPGS
ncbi:MAG: TadE/TadG family type IV pilus assembly protein [Planctomycetota bacterium]|jgi:hypothetical protein